MFWLLPLHLIIFLRISLILLFGAYLFVSPFCLLFCACLDVLGRSSMIPKLVMSAFWCRCFKGLRGRILEITWTRCSRNNSCVGYMLSPIVVESWMLFAHSWVELILKLADYKDRPHSLCMSCYSGAVPEAELFLAGYGVCWSPPLAMPLVGPSYCVVWSPPVVMLVWGPLCLGSGADQCEML